MYLSSGKISNPNIVKEYINDYILYAATSDVYISLIRIYNNSAYPVSFTLSVLYDNKSILAEKTLNAKDTYRFTERLYLSNLNDIRCNSASDNVLEYIVNGGDVTDESSEASISVFNDNATTIGGDVDSEQIFKLIPAGSESTSDRAYNSYPIAQNVARSDAVDAKRYLIDIREPGEINITDGGLSGNSDFNDYVNIKGINRNVKLILTAKTYTNTAGTVLIENVNIIYDNSGAGAVTMDGQTFKDCYFDLDCSTFDFENCKFEGVCYIKAVAGTVTFTTCNGGMVVTNADPGDNMFGYFGMDTADF